MDIDFINSLHPVLWIKIVTLIVILFYIFFTFVVFTQVKAMSAILHFPRSKKLFRTISVIHTVLAISLFLIALVIL